MRRGLAVVLGCLAVWMAGASAGALKDPAPPLRADKVLIEKAHRRMTLFWRGRPVKAYRVSLGGEPKGKKQCEGDNRTPEGLYRIDARNAWSAYHLSLHVTYPSAEDVAKAKDLGCRPGGDIMIHGLPNGDGGRAADYAGVDWTLGCIAVTDPEIEEIWKAVPNGTVVEIRP